MIAPAMILTMLWIAPSAGAQQNRITRNIDNSDRVSLTGHIHPKSLSGTDQGPVARSLTLSNVTLAISPSAAQTADLEELLKEQQDPTSKNYHRWLTPEQYAARFGASDADISSIASWIQSQGLKLDGVGRGRSWIAVSGSAPLIEAAFGTELHSYLVDGKVHFANATEPSLPAAIAGVVKNIRGLNDFRMKPAKRMSNPQYTSTKGNHYLSPDDIAAIYNVTPLYLKGVDGTGQKLVVAGQTQIDLSDIRTFRSKFGLPANDPQVTLVPGTRDPGISSDDLPEADLDLEWAGAMARNASILYVYSDDVMVAVQYAIDQNLAPIVSTSYGSCEPETSTADALTLQSWARQGNSQGITWFAASGDTGGADCADARNSGLAVDLPGSIPEVTSVGGTEFADATGTYWNPSTSSTGASALSYIPEVAWNDSALDGSPSATGGGASVLFTKPSWQTGTGVPDDSARHVPDISLAASADHDGYLVYSGGSLQVYGGTSVPTPTFAGMTALLNQLMAGGGTTASAGLGNINPQLYTLAQTSPNAFHDITTGDNVVTVPCPRRAQNCTAAPVGYTAATAYDQVTGLGSIDLSVLSDAWVSALSTSAQTLP